MVGAVRIEESLRDWGLASQVQAGRPAMRMRSVRESADERGRETRSLPDTPSTPLNLTPSRISIPKKRFPWAVAAT